MEKKSARLQGKRIALCVAGSIAAIESPKLARELRRHGAEVQAYMSDAALDILHPNAMEFATGKEVITKISGKLEHLYSFDLVLVAPATANIIGKIANGIADSVISTLVLSTRARVVLAPAMHEEMYESRILRENLGKLRRYGYGFVEPRFREGKAKMAKIEDIVDRAIYELYDKDLKGKKVVVTAGPTVEYIDPIRIITNKSSGKMGIAVAREAYFRGADVKLIYGYGIETPPPYLAVVHVETGQEMLAASLQEMPCDIFISAAAVSDFTVKEEKEKLKSDREIDIKLIPTPKILEKIKKHRCIKVGFKALHSVSEAELVDAASQAREKYGLDLVVANDVARDIFRSDESEVYLVSGEGVEHIPRTSKDEIAIEIFNRIRNKL
jgi:phosphopantothenoylcysteine decarboxylase/phosphopantothenate--cysteine ligase